MKPGAILGEELTLDLLVDTDFDTKVPGLHLRSFPIAYFLTMQLDVIHANLRETKDIEAFGALGAEQDDWIRSMAQAHNQKEDVNKIFGKITGQENKFIHTNYDDKLWPATAPSVSMPVGDTHLLRMEELQAISDNLGIPSTTTAGMAPSPVAPPSKVVYVHAKDKDVDKEAVSQVAFYLGLFLRGNIDWKTGEVTNPLLPIMNKAIVDTMELKSVDLRARKIKSLMHKIIDPDNIDKLDGASALHSMLFQGNISLTYIQDSLADLIDSINGEAGEIDIYQLTGQTSGSAKVTHARERDARSQCDEDFDQHKHHKGKKQTSIEKLGSLGTRFDVVKLAANTLTLSLLIENMALQAKNSITYQILERFITFFSSTKIIAWIDDQAETTPQFSWQMARWAE